MIGLGANRMIGGGLGWVRYRPAASSFPTTGLKAFYDFNEASGTTAEDGVNSYDGTYSDAALRATGGLVNKVCAFDGAKYVGFGSATNYWGISDLDYSLLALVYVPASISTAQLDIIHLAYSSSSSVPSQNSGLFLGIRPDGSVIGRLITGSISASWGQTTGRGQFRSNELIKFSAWNLVAFVRDADGSSDGTGYVYIANSDEVVSESAAYTGANSLIWQNRNNDIGVARSSVGSIVRYAESGVLLDYVGLYDSHALTFSEFQTIWSSGSPLIP